MSAEQQQQPIEQQYLIKMIKLGTRRCPIILQSKNGPCPLLAIVNTLTLRGTDMRINTNKQYVSSSHLVDILGSYLLDYSTQQQKQQQQQNSAHDGEITNNSNKNVEETTFDISQALGILPEIKDGLNVNVRFNGCTQFEETPEIRIFSLMKTKLVHGWIVDAQDEALSQAIGDLTYTQAVEKVFLMRDVMAAENGSLDNRTLLEEYTVEQREKIKRDGLLISEFLDSSPSQMTEVGLLALHEVLGDHNLAVLFRNNHFATICKYNGRVHLLCTDEGFADQEDVVWERIDDISGDNIYCRGDFSLFQNTVRHEDVMNQIQMSEERRLQKEKEEQMDFELAMQLQRQEQAAVQNEQQRQLNGSSSTSSAHPQQQPTRSVPSANNGQTMVDLNTSSVPHGALPTIRQQREMMKPTTPKSSGNNRYMGQAEQLSELNAQRRQREEQQKREDPQAFNRRVSESRKREKNNNCSIQ